MRISDWSSDVCSSDLAAGSRTGSQNCLGAGNPEADNELPHSIRAGCGVGGHGLADVAQQHAEDYRHAWALARCLRIAARNRVGAAVDRSSVGSGKSVAVRVVLGGAGIVKKKTIS